MVVEFYEKLLNDVIKDKRLKIYLYDYITTSDDEYFNPETSKYFENCIKIFINIFRDIKIEELSWKLLCNQVSNSNIGAKHLIKFYGYILKIGINLGEHTKFLRDNCWIFMSEGYDKILNYKKYYLVGSTPLDIFMIKNNKMVHFYEVHFDSEFLSNLMRKFIKYCEVQNKTYFGYSIYKFITCFEKSFGKSEDIPKVIEEFGYETMLTQFQYYKLKNEECKPYLKHLNYFYRFLINYFENNNSQHKLFNNGSGIDRTFLFRENFNTLFGKGYRVVYYNKFDEIPQNDKWLLAPNGYEKYTTTIKSIDYIPLEFSRVKDNVLRHKLKKWFMVKRKSLKALRNSVNNLFIFFEVIEGGAMANFRKNIVNLHSYAADKKNSSIINEYTILFFREYINQKYDNVNTVNGYISSINSFVKFLDEEGDFFINPTIYSYLRITTVKNLNGKIIIQEDLDIILETFKNRMLNGNYIDRMFFVFFHLLLTTNFRPNEILNLKRSCIKPGMKKGDFVIDYTSEDEGEVNRDTLEMQNKTSHGKDIEANPSEYTIRAINEAKYISKDYWEEANSDIKEYIFIYKSINNQVEGIKLDRFYRLFKRITSKLNLKGGPYTLYNCRTTYMTKLFENAVKEGNVYKAIIATGHKDFTTTIKHYIKPDVRNYLEAFYNIKLGNVNLQGRIVAELSEVILDIPMDIREITVKKGCGFCSGTCDEKEKIECLICRNFVVTLDRIPYFKESIKNIDELIKNENILHEKEHLVSIKKIYVAFLGELYTLKEKRGE
ncbi:tyrosine-type recombinase/integrase [Clostridium sp.]|uniref:tyrosine-type recombinase/integrase n=1 Tax=Clostridium sp. TaxID=1506 RepID=UPI0026350B59|nr:tyrosine-type recombinase/integrase [uncultured Clostridium sp.]